jgi:hypothetical protein
MVERMAGSRLHHAQKYLTAYPELTFWRQALTFLQTAQWLHLNLRSGSKNFDWLIKLGQDGMDNCLKLFEGKFQELHQASSTQRSYIPHPGGGIRSESF